MKNQKGFSLIELLIVVVIIGIIAAIAIPNLLASRRSANEGASISALRTIHGAQMTYGSTYGGGNFAGDTAFGSATGMTALMGVQLVDSATGVTATGSRRFGIVTEGTIYWRTDFLGNLQIDDADIRLGTAIQ